MSKRESWDSYFMGIARQVATRHTCPPRTPTSPNGVGAAIVRDRVILSTGYNGSIRGLEHCDEAGHMMENDHCVRTVHAEANAIVQAAKNGVRIEGATIYTTASPCWPCLKLIANSGIVRIVFGLFYKDERIFEVCQKLGIALVDLSPKEEPEKVVLPDADFDRVAARLAEPPAPSPALTALAQRHQGARFAPSAGGTLFTPQLFQAFATPEEDLLGNPGEQQAYFKCGCTGPASASYCSNHPLVTKMSSWEVEAHRKGEEFDKAHGGEPDVNE